MKFSRNLSEKELAEHKDQSITLRTTKSYYLTGKVHRCESCSIRLLFIRPQTEQLLSYHWLKGPDLVNGRACIVA